MSENPLQVPFECTCCGVCCTLHQALVELHEVGKISEFLGITQDHFIEIYADKRWKVSEKILLKHNAPGGCVFLSKKDDLSLCSIHKVKPSVCRSWESSLARKECRQGLSNKLGVSVGQLGHLSGATKGTQPLNSPMNNH